MGGKRAVGLVAVVLIVVLLCTGIGPAWAQAGMQPFEKPAWGLTMQYPEGWEVTDQDEAVSFVYDDGASDVAVFHLVRDPAYTNLNLDFTDLLNDALGKVGAEVENVSLEEAQAWAVAGAQARGVVIYGTDTFSGLEMEGELYQWATGGQGYVLVAATTVDTWDSHEADLYSMMDSIQLGGAAAPTKTPAPTPRRVTPTPKKPTPAPTEEVVPTEEPLPTEEAVPTRRPAAQGAMTAREAYGIALAEAQTWNDAATLVFAFCRGMDAGKSARWTMVFSSNPDDPTQAEGRAVVVANGQADPKDAYESDVSSDLPVGEDWLDSTDAVQVFLNEGGGAGFLERHPNALITQTSLSKLGLDSPTTWWIAATVTGVPGQLLKWVCSVDAASGTIDQSPAEATENARKYTTAREALGLVQKAVEQWGANAYLMQVRGSVKPNEPGYAAGKVGKWTFDFRAPEVGARDFYLDGDEVKSEESATDREAITGDWLDSAGVLKKLRGLPDYAAFVEMNPKPAFYFTLEMDKDLGLTWEVVAEVKGAALGLTLSGAQALALPVTPSSPAATPTQAVTQGQAEAGTSGKPLRK